MISIISYGRMFLSRIKNPFPQGQTLATFVVTKDCIAGGHGADNANLGNKTNKVLVFSIF